MSRLAALAALLLLASPLATLAGAQAPPGYAIPTQQDAIVGGLNVTAWIMRDTRTITYTPDLRQNPLGYLWNLNFTAGSLGIVYVKATVVEPDTYGFDIAVSSPSPLLQVVAPSGNQSLVNAQTGACSPSVDKARCQLGGNVTSADATFQFFVAGSARPGPLPLDIAVATSRNTTGGLVQAANRTFHYTLTIIDPLPPFAVRARVDDTTLGAWTNGGPLGAAAGGCLGGSAVGRDENVSQGAPAVICLVAVTGSEDRLRLSARVSGASWLVAPAEPWVSEPFNLTSGGAAAPVHGFLFQTNGQAPLGPSKATLHYQLERETGGTWQSVGEGDMEVPLTVTAVALVPRGATGINWLAHAPLLLASVAGLGYMAYTSRSPKLQPRSQALKAEQVRRKTKDDDAASTVIADQQRQEVQEQAWQKKLQILEAKRADILASIKVAEERHQRGEITEHVLNGIRERKERQLEQVAKEMEEVR